MPNIEGWQMHGTTVAWNALSHDLAGLDGEKAWTQWRGRVPPALEVDYLATLMPTMLRVMRTWLAVGVMLDLAMVWDVALAGVSATWPLLIELGLHLPLALGVGWGLGRVRGVWLRESMFIVVGLASIVCVGVESGLGPPSFVSRYLMLAAMTLFSALLLVPLRPRSAGCLALLGLATTITVTLTCHGPAASGNWDMLVFTGLLTLLGLRARVGLDAEGRRSYLLRVQDQLYRQELARSNARLLELSDTDPLTGAGNRRSFERTLDRLVQTGIGEHLALVMIDVDHFKQFNDMYGHPRGDECLQLVAHTLREHIRDVQDHVARYGGEEFAAILPGADIKVATEVAERMRLAVGALQIPHVSGSEPPMLVTISIGVATIVVGRETRQVLVTNADQALYAAKASGRNCVRCYDDIVTEVIAA